MTRDKKTKCARCGTDLSVEISLIGTFIFDISPQGDEVIDSGVLISALEECLLPEEDGRPEVHCYNCGAHQEETGFVAKPDPDHLFIVVPTRGAGSL